MKGFLLVLATTTTLAANVRWPPQLKEEDAGVIVRGRAVSVVSQRVVVVARADVIVGMHGAAMTHLLFAKQRAVAVELFSGTLISLRKGGGLWFFARYTKGYYGKIFLDRGPRQERSTLDAVQAARTVRCAGEASSGPRAKRPSCDGVK